MAKERLCRKCGAVLGIDDDRCQQCGAANPVTLPWYGPIVGFAIIGLIVYFLVDLSVWEGILDRLFN
ncbi:MAG TPA: hypothetical protein VJL84_02425 [Kiloniellales bacterium]|nr:hypothetical protein [Kiloniellales bacterium]